MLQTLRIPICIFLTSDLQLHKQNYIKQSTSSYFKNTMKNNTTNHTAINNRYTGKNSQLASKLIHETAAVKAPSDFHHNPVTSEPKNKTVDDVRRIQENSGLRIIWGWILKQLQETGHSSLLPYTVMDSRVKKIALENNFMLSLHQKFNFITRNDAFISFLLTSK